MRVKIRRLIIGIVLYRIIAISILRITMTHDYASIPNTSNMIIICKLTIFSTDW